MTSAFSTVNVPTVMDDTTFNALPLLGFRFLEPARATHFNTAEQRFAARGYRELRISLPEGWRTEGTRLVGWTVLRDGGGRRRGEFRIPVDNDTGDFLRLYTRYMFRQDYRATPKPHQVYEVIDRLGPEAPLFVSPTVFLDAAQPQAIKAREEVLDWLDETLPGWSSPSRHWDEERPEAIR